MDVRRRDLIDVALGHERADLAIRGVTLMNVASREFHPADIVVKGNRIAAVLDPAVGAELPPARETIDGTGYTAAPGLIDPHVHIESSMVTVTEYARTIVPRGTTMIAADPHEIGNVLGLAGMELLFTEARGVPLKIRLRVPGRIPAVPAWMETSNATLSLEDTRGMFDWPEAVCLAGDINPELVLGKDPEQLDKIEMAIGLGVTVSGQSPRLSGRNLAAFLSAGPEDSHVAGSVDEVIENTRAGMRSVLALRPGRRLDAGHFAALARVIGERNLDTRLFQFCTDDIHANDLLHEGHLDHRIRTAIAAGIDPITAYQFATLNVAEGLRIDRDHGSIAPGKHADILLLEDVAAVRVAMTIIDGQVVYRDGSYRGPKTPYRYPDWARGTVRLAKELGTADLAVRAPGNEPAATVRMIVTGGRKLVKEVELPVEGGLVLPDPARGINALAMVERHRKSGNIGRGFVEGVGLQSGALASSVNHDAHNIAVFGANYEDMALAVNRLAEIQGGYVVAKDGEIVAELPLPIAGLMSEKPIEQVADEMEHLEKVLFEELGCPSREKIFTQLNFLCLPNIPDYGFTDKGLVETGGKLALLETVVAPGTAARQ